MFVTQLVALPSDASISPSVTRAARERMSIPRPQAVTGPDMLVCELPNATIAPRIK